MVSTAVKIRPAAAFLQARLAINVIPIANIASNMIATVSRRKLREGFFIKFTPQSAL
jgi:hypothetical protein